MNPSTDRNRKSNQSRVNPGTTGHKVDTLNPHQRDSADSPFTSSSDHNLHEAWTHSNPAEPPPAAGKEHSITDHARRANTTILHKTRQDDGVTSASPETAATVSGSLQVDQRLHAVAQILAQLSDARDPEAPQNETMSVQPVHQIPSPPSPPNPASNYSLETTEPPQQLTPKPHATVPASHNETVAVVDIQISKPSALFQLVLPSWDPTEGLSKQLTDRVALIFSVASITSFIDMHDEYSMQSLLLPETSSDHQTQLQMHLYILNHGHSILYDYDQLVSRANSLQITQNSKLELPPAGTLSGLFLLK
ncbi:hypothetical protein BKA64DRAFT_714024 [Cadophora sp. MPI-SDFR-AT-0126]|nr:hypothetical protein BKA64DRAFT_714024 [Leotiomycetes sp. MPI-SDFR-AT-0126]